MGEGYSTSRAGSEAGVSIEHYWGSGGKVPLKGQQGTGGLRGAGGGGSRRGVR